MAAECQNTSAQTSFAPRALRGALRCTPHLFVCSLLPCRRNAAQRQSPCMPCRASSTSPSQRGTVVVDYSGRVAGCTTDSRARPLLAKPCNCICLLTAAPRRVQSPLPPLTTDIATSVAAPCAARLRPWPGSGARLPSFVLLTCSYAYCSGPCPLEGIRKDRGPAASAHPPNNATGRPKHQARQPQSKRRSATRMPSVVRPGAASTMVQGGTNLTSHGTRRGRRPAWQARLHARQHRPARPGCRCRLGQHAAKALWTPGRTARMSTAVLLACQGGGALAG
jgi:hypothetical protein